jgi:hypothetical protein
MVESGTGEADELVFDAGTKAAPDAEHDLFEGFTGAAESTGNFSQAFTALIMGEQYRGITRRQFLQA